MNIENQKVTLEQNQYVLIPSPPSLPYFWLCENGMWDEKLRK
jgi:hypothetical protein